MVENKNKKIEGGDEKQYNRFIQMYSDDNDSGTSCHCTWNGFRRYRGE